jgi:hypothetical protein
MTRTPLGRPGFLALVALKLLVATAAAAQGGMSPAQRRVGQACMPDISSHCANVERGSGRVVACLRQNIEKVSPACREALGGLQR